MARDLGISCLLTFGSDVQKNGITAVNVSGSQIFDRTFEEGPAYLISPRRMGSKGECNMREKGKKLARLTCFGFCLLIKPNYGSVASGYLGCQGAD